MRCWPPEGSWLPSAIGSVLGRLSLTLEQKPFSQAQGESNRGREESDPFRWETDLQSSPTQASSQRLKMTEWQELYWRRWKKDYSYALIEKKNSWVVEVSRANKSSCDNHILHLVSGQNAWFQPSDSHLSSPWHWAFFVYYTLDAFSVNGNSWYNHLCTSITHSFLPSHRLDSMNLRSLATSE